MRKFEITLKMTKFYELEWVEYNDLALSPRTVDKVKHFITFEDARKYIDQNRKNFLKYSLCKIELLEECSNEY